MQKCARIFNRSKYTRVCQKYAQVYNNNVPGKYRKSIGKVP